MKQRNGVNWSRLMIACILGVTLFGFVTFSSVKSIGLTTGFTFVLDEPYPLENVYVLAGGPGGGGTYEDILLPSGINVVAGYFVPPGFTVPVGPSGFGLEQKISSDVMDVYAVLGTYTWVPTGETHLVIGTGGDLTGVSWSDIIHTSGGITYSILISMLQNGGPIGGATSLFDIAEHLHTEGNMAPLGSEIQLYFFSAPGQPLDVRVIANEYGNPEPPPLKTDTVLDFWFTPNPVPPGNTVTLSGTLETVGGSPVYPASVSVEYSTNGGVTWNYIWTLNTNAAGEFSKTFSAPGVGTYLARVSYAGSALYNPSSHTETLMVQMAWGDYHLQISPFIDVMHIKISGNVIYGIDDAAGSYHNQPVLGYKEGDSFYVFIDFTKDDFGDPIYYELAMLVGSVSTLSGNLYQTTDGTSWVGPTAFSLVSASSLTESSASGQAVASPSAVEPEGWPATYHFQISPFIDVMHVHVDGQVVHGLDDATTYHNQPVLGWISGDKVYFAIDYTKNDDGSPIYYELSISVVSLSTKNGNMYRTTDGKSWVGPTAITLVPT